GVQAAASKMQFGNAEYQIQRRCPMQARRLDTVAFALFNMLTGAAGICGALFLVLLVVGFGSPLKWAAIPAMLLLAGVSFTLSGVYLLRSELDRGRAMVVLGLGIVFGVAYCVPMFLTNPDAPGHDDPWAYLMVIVPAAVVSFALLEWAYL